MKVLVTLATFVLLSTACGSDSKKASPSPAPATTATNTNTETNTNTSGTGDVAAGKTLWTDNACVACHGKDAKSGTAKVDLSETSASNFSKAIKNGATGMESYPDIDDQGIKDLQAYVASLSK